MLTLLVSHNTLRPSITYTFDWELKAKQLGREVCVCVCVGGGGGGVNTK